eukprot:130195_1
MGNFFTSRNVSRGFPPQTGRDFIDGAFTGVAERYADDVYDDGHFLYPLRRKTIEEFERDLKKDMVWGIYAERPALLDHRKNRRATYLQNIAHRSGQPIPQNEDLSFYNEKVLNDRHNFTIQPVLTKGVCRTCNQVQGGLSRCPSMKFLYCVDNVEDLVKPDQLRNASLTGIVHSGQHVTFSDFLQECRAADQIYLLNVHHYYVHLNTDRQKPVFDGFFALQRWSGPNDMVGKTYLYIYRRTDNGT